MHFGQTALHKSALDRPSFPGGFFQAFGDLRAIISGLLLLVRARSELAESRNVFSLAEGERAQSERGEGALAQRLVTRLDAMECMRQVVDQNVPGAGEGGRSLDMAQGLRPYPSVHIVHLTHQNKAMFPGLAFMRCGFVLFVAVHLVPSFPPSCLITSLLSLF